MLHARGQAESYALARRYTGARAPKVAEVLDTLVALGQARGDALAGYSA